MKYQRKPRKGKHQLPAKKELTVLKSKLHPNMYYIAYKEGGTLPSEVKSEFTKRKFAENFLDRYLKKQAENKSYLEHVREKEYAESQREEGK